eukprot:8535169-Ditylum_brightwellii.AAC.1
MAYSLSERIRIKFEIFWENAMDRFGDFDRRPMIFLAAIAVMATLRTAQKGIGSVKPSMLSSSRGLDHPSFRGSSPYGASSPYGHSSPY